MVNAERISSNENGGASVYYSHIKLLHRIGYRIELLVSLWREDEEFQQKDYVEIENYVSGIHCFKAHKETPTKNKLVRLKQSIFNPVEFEYVFVNDTNRKNLTNIVNSINPDLLWCEWRWTAIMTANSFLNKPIVYAHHDWEYKLAQLRKTANIEGKFHIIQKKRVEFDLVKKVTACVTGSYSEANEIEKISGKKALYLPTSYNKVDIVNTPNKQPNIVHLGGMNTTANRLGLERFIDVCWEDIKAALPEVRLVVIGGLKGASDNLLKKLENDTSIDCLGFVKDLNLVMKPQDIHIIPWEYNTGTRTRVPVVFNYGQVLVATQESVKAFPELINGENSILCDGLKPMIKEIVTIYSNSNLRKEIGENGKQTFLNKFTEDSLKEKLQNFLETEVL